jgi:MoxR-like ATPase
MVSLPIAESLLLLDNPFDMAYRIESAKIWQVRPHMTVSPSFERSEAEAMRQRNLTNFADSSPEPAYFSNSFEHLTAELQRLDLLIQWQVRRSKQLHRTDEQFRGLYVSEQEVDDMLGAPLGSPRFLTVGDPEDNAATYAAFNRMGNEIAERIAGSALRGISLRLEEIVRLFKLTSFDAGCLLVCLAPEIDPRYERLYSYIQDDVTKKRPSVELVLNLLCPTLNSKLEARKRFECWAPLQHWKMVHRIEDTSQPQGAMLARPLRMDERIVNYLTGSDEIDSQLLPYTEFVTGLSEPCPTLPEAHRSRLIGLSQSIKGGAILYFHGPSGIGKRECARALSNVAGRGLLTIDLDYLANADHATFQDVIRRAARESRILKASLYCRGFGALLPDERHFVREKLLAELRGLGGLSFLEAETAWEPPAHAAVPFVSVEFSRLAFAERSRLWASAMPTAGETGLDLEAIAGKFRFTGDQIRDAAATAANLALWRDPFSPRITDSDLYEACRLHSNRKLASLARKINPRHGWDDIILPADRGCHLREICSSVKHRELVFEQWGFDRKLSLGKGLNILFAGPPGTGKTMAAEIMAGELGLDLYKIDLSSLVSKYIGETEKNLARIFSEAETSNAILFFDEADALFGKRSEVRDSHDRYANIEVGYLLQRMEEYEGVVILATNFRKNMDDAFVRRIQFTVEFPFPNEADRKRIWLSIWPETLPIDADVDLDFLAERFELTGGSIKNIALAAAFLAAENGRVVKMTHLLHATRREYQKTGKVVGHAEFEHRRAN